MLLQLIKPFAVVGTMFMRGITTEFPNSIFTRTFSRATSSKFYKTYIIDGSKLNTGHA